MALRQCNYVLLCATVFLQSSVSNIARVSREFNTYVLAPSFRFDLTHNENATAISNTLFCETAVRKVTSDIEKHGRFKEKMLNLKRFKYLQVYEKMLPNSVDLCVKLVSMFVFLRTPLYGRLCGKQTFPAWNTGTTFDERAHGGAQGCGCVAMITSLWPENSPMRMASARTNKEGTMWPFSMFCHVRGLMIVVLLMTSCTWFKKSRVNSRL